MLRLELELFPPSTATADASRDNAGESVHKNSACKDRVQKDNAEQSYTDVNADKDVVIVIDMLRMTTTATLLFTQGLQALYIVAAVEAARQVAREQQCLLLGERGGVALAGFDGGNSPSSYLHEDMRGKRAVLCTSNGSKAVQASQHTRHVLLGAVLNAAATAKQALQLAEHSIYLRCAGTAGRLSLEDVLAAACILREICQRRSDVHCSDACRMALQLLPPAGVGFVEALQRQLLLAEHAQHLLELGFADDLQLACAHNRFPHVALRQQQDAALSVFGAAVPEAEVSGR